MKQLSMRSARVVRSTFWLSQKSSNEKIRGLASPRMNASFGIVRCYTNYFTAMQFSFLQLIVNGQGKHMLRPSLHQRTAGSAARNLIDSGLQIQHPVLV